MTEKIDDWDVKHQYKQKEESQNRIENTEENAIPTKQHLGQGKAETKKLSGCDFLPASL